MCLYGCDDRNRGRHNGQRVVGIQRLRQLDTSGSFVDEDNFGALDFSHGPLADACLLLWIPVLPDGDVTLEADAFRRKGTAVDPVQQSLALEISQIPADGFLGDAQLFGKAHNCHLTVSTGESHDLSTPLECVHGSLPWKSPAEQKLHRCD